MTPEMIQEILSVVIGAILQIATLGGTIFMFLRKYNISLIDKKAEAEVDHAIAEKTTIEATESSLNLHMKAVMELIDRDMKIVDLSRRFGEYESKSLVAEKKNTERINQLELELRDTQKTLDLERNVREVIQRQLDDERKIRGKPGLFLEDTIPIRDDDLKELSKHESRA